jgi:hypothetical protein
MIARFALASWLLPLASLGGCGGGGSAPAEATQQVQGKVVQQGLGSAGLAGIEATCVTTGAVTTTRQDGTFEFDVPPGTPIELRIGANAAVSVDCDERTDGKSDGFDSSDQGLEIEALREGEVVYLEIELRGGVIVECWIDGEGRGPDGGEGECPLLPSPLLPDGVRAEVEVQRDEGCLAIELEVVGLEGPQTLTALLLAGGGTATLGEVQVNADGAGHLEARVCPDDLSFPEVPPLPELPTFPELPPGGIPGYGDLPSFPIDLLPDGTFPDGLLPTIPELPFPPLPPESDPFLGATVVLVDAAGNTLFVGFVPGPGLEPGEGWSEPGGTPPGLGDLEELKDLLGLPGLPDDIDAIFDLVNGAFPPR